MKENVKMENRIALDKKKKVKKKKRLQNNRKSFLTQILLTVFNLIITTSVKMINLSGLLLTQTE
jgi:hypothetical protein